MSSQKPDYRIYPSLLDKFQELLDYEIAVEDDFNKVSETAVKENRYPGKEVGDYILTPDEMSDKLEKELIDSINRVPHEPWEAADKGTAFNEVVDCIIAGRECSIEGMVIDYTAEGIHVSYDGFDWLFDTDFCNEFAGQLKGSMSQVFTSATIDTEYGTVELYGYIDEWLHDQVIDIKTTGRYSFLKFERKWQRHVYPYCLVENGHEVRGFEYRVVQWKGGTKIQPAMYGDVIPEYYTYDHEQSKAELTEMVERFVSWLNLHRDQITDRKVFGGENGPEKPSISVAEDIDSDFIIDEKFSFLPANLGHFDSIDDAMKAIAKAGMFATAEGTAASRALTEEELQEIRDSITDIVENERIDACKDVADALAFEERMKAEIKRRKDHAQAILSEIDARIMEKAKMVKENRKNVSLTGEDTVRVSVSDKNLYYHLEDGALVLASVGYASNDEMSGLFYQAEINEDAMRKLFDIKDFAKERTFDVVRISDMADEELIGRQMICDPELTYFEDFIDEDSGTTLTTKRTKKFGLKRLPANVTEELLAKLKEDGFNTILLQKTEE